MSKKAFSTGYCCIHATKSNLNGLERSLLIFLFLIHRQSKDKLSGLIEVFSREAFNQWVTEGMKGDYQEYACFLILDRYLNSISTALQHYRKWGKSN